jgi:beta-alanine degradation protein BauB
MHDVTELTPFDPAEFAEEIRAAATNFRVATECQLETDRIRVWDFVLQPGYRHPFHCHRTNYCWICTASGSAIQRLPDGQRSLQRFRIGDTDYLEASESNPLIHDIESVGDSTLRFVTIELLG